MILSIEIVSFSFEIVSNEKNNVHQIFKSKLELCINIIKILQIFFIRHLGHTYFIAKTSCFFTCFDETLTMLSFRSDLQFFFLLFYGI